MKNLALSLVWCPGIVQVVEETVKHCDPCQKSWHVPAMAPLQLCEWPQHPWAYLHVDCAGPRLGRMFLLIVDTYSNFKWMEISVCVQDSLHPQLPLNITGHCLPHTDCLNC